MELVELPLPAVQRFVQLYEVNVLTLQAAQRGFERPTRIVVGADLGRDRDPLTVRLQDAADQQLRGAVAVAGRGIEEGDAALDRTLHGGRAVALGSRRTPSRAPHRPRAEPERSEEHTSELQSLAYLVCRLLLEKKKNTH